MEVMEQRVCPVVVFQSNRTRGHGEGPVCMLPDPTQPGISLWEDLGDIEQQSLLEQALKARFACVVPTLLSLQAAGHAWGN
jgi:hypothetical protein